MKRGLNQQFGRQGRKNHPSRTAKGKGNFFFHEESLRNLWDNMKCDNINIMGMPE